MLTQWMQSRLLRSFRGHLVLDRIAVRRVGLSLVVLSAKILADLGLAVHGRGATSYSYMYSNPPEILRAYVDEIGRKAFSVVPRGGQDRLTCAEDTSIEEIGLGG
mmetsp:Transcript_12007/g.34338  ORF Transcript_12007/g.34338 Transcript_12007/m.34338 type:complete len:105 (+) Transcript_12007:47-361(+)